MKKVVLILILFLTAFFISGCITGNVIMNSCKEPYTYVGGSCCLDENQDGICDKDKAEIRSYTGSDECKFNREFSCLGKRITRNSIELKLRHDRAGIASITKIELPNVGKGCKQITNGLVEDGIDYNQEKTILIQCPYVDDHIDTPMLLEANVYEKSDMKGNSLSPYTVYPISTEGHLSGSIEEL